MNTPTHPAENVPKDAPAQTHLPCVELPRSGPGALGPILLDWRGRVPETGLLLVRAGLEPPARQLGALRETMARLAAQGRSPVVLAPGSNGDERANPFAGLPIAVPAPASEELESLVGLLASGRLHPLDHWPTQLALLSPEAVEVLARADTTASNAPGRLRDAGGRLLLAEALFLHDPAADLAAEARLQPHEARQPPPWGELSARLGAWLQSPEALAEPATLAALARYTDGDAPVTLHITHSWGGGVARWVDSMIEADAGGVHLQLRSEGPQSGRGAGQRLALYLGARADTPIEAWWLQPPISSCDDTRSDYRAVLEQVLRRHGVGRVIVSSLVGHSLDALSTGRPTVQVLHDYFPAWPLLGVHPGPFLRPGQPADLAAAISQHGLLKDLSDRDADSWAGMARRWREAVAQGGVRLAAPSRSVVSLLQRLDPAWADAEITVIPHGLPDSGPVEPVAPRARADGRLRLVIPGRVQEGKGEALLRQALPELTRHARICLLGAGQGGQAFFGEPDVDVIVQYRREDLPGLMQSIAPDLAALLSVVPETFSYTLSEMQQLGVPVVATRVGSLEERIEDQATGWLIEPSAEALLARIAELAADRQRIDSVRDRLRALAPPGAGEMAAQYRALCAPSAQPREIAREGSSGGLQLAALAWQASRDGARIRRLEQRTDELQREVEKRSEWAEERERARQQEEERRIQWVTALEGQLEERFDELQEAREALDREQIENRKTVANLTAMQERLQAEHDWVVASRSWRYTRPFRVAGRVLANFARMGAHDPRRWGLLLSQSVRTIRTRGWRGALLRAQHGQQQPFEIDRVDVEAVEAIGDPTPPAALPHAANPDVSIVIPVHGKWPFTAACLRSLVEARNRATFEVIVVDDCSPDETAERLSGVDGLIRVANERNLGFIGSCNRGAEKARGRYLLMLNNDTQVLDGWLDALLDVFDRFPDTGLAGARLVYPDGRLQEAGGIVFNDGSGWNYGRNDDAERPEYGFVRQADYCSGACIMLPAALWQELGGFDPRYSPAYYEDTDLAFRIRERGLKVRVQPAATVVHHEGVSSGTDLASGVKRHQVVNREKFLERWQQALQQQPAPIVDPGDRAEIRRARDHRLKGRVLIIDAYTPEPDQDSGSLRLNYLMKCFADLGYGVSFMPDNRARAGRYTRELQQAGVEVLHDPWIGSLQRFFAERGNEFDFVMISRHYVASRYVPLLRRHCPRARFIFDTVDLHYLREERLAELEDSLPLKRAAAQTRRSELAVIEAADATLVVSPVEKTVLHEAAPGARVHVISNVHEVVGSRCPFAERKDLFFVGGYQHPPNIDAAQWFVNSVWPLVRADLPDVEFHLIGSKAPDSVRALDGNGVRFQGFVEDLEPWLDGCRLAVAPLRYGAGIKGKVNMSMSRGQPVVATPVAVEGMYARPGDDVLVAESAEDFAAAVVRLYRDEELWNRISALGQENVQKYFSVETARLGLQELLAALSDKTL